MCSAAKTAAKTAERFHEKILAVRMVYSGNDLSGSGAKRAGQVPLSTGEDCRWQISANDERKLFATLDCDNAAKTVRVEIPSLGKPAETVDIKHLPFYVYNFDLASLNFAFRHLRDPQGSFVIGIADPTFANKGGNE